MRGITINRLPLHAHSITYYIHIVRFTFSRKRHEYFVRPETCNCIDYAKYTPMFYSRDLFSEIKRIVVHHRLRLYINLRLYERDFLAFGSAFPVSNTIARESCDYCIYQDAEIVQYLCISELFMAIKLFMRDCPARR